MPAPAEPGFAVARPPPAGPPGMATDPIKRRAAGNPPGSAPGGPSARPQDTPRGMLLAPGAPAWQPGNGARARGERARSFSAIQI